MGAKVLTACSHNLETFFIDLTNDLQELCCHGQISCMKIMCHNLTLKKPDFIHISIGSFFAITFLGNVFLKRI